MLDIKEQIREYIYSGAGTIGAILSEREITQQLKLKRGYVREILLTLEGEGIIRSIPKKGYCYVDYNGTDIKTLNAIRYAIEREALRKAIGGAMTRDDKVRLTLIHEDLERFAAEQNTKSFSECDMEFHTAIIEASHDNMLIKMFNFLKATVFRLHAVCSRRFDDQFENTQLAHRAIFAGIKNEDMESAEKSLEKHIGTIKIKNNN